MDKDNSKKIVNLCETVIRWGLYAFAFLAPLFFLPFNTNILELNKQLLLVVFCLLLLISWLGKMIAQGKIEMKKSWLNIGLAIFAIFYLVSSVLSKNVYQSLIGFGGTISESFFVVISLIIIFFVMVNNLRNREDLTNLSLILVFSGLLAGLFGAFQLAGKFILPWEFAKSANFNTVGSANALEIFLASMLVLSAVLFSELETAKWRQAFFGVAAGFFLIMVLSINFSNVWWALLLTIIMIVSLSIIKRDRINQYRLILPMLVLAFSVLMLLPLRLNIFTWLTIPVEVSPSTSATLAIDKQVLKDSFFFGKGPGAFAYAYGLYKDKVLNQTDFWNVRFNQGFSKISSQPVILGVTGFLAWLATVVGFAVYGFVVLIRRKGKNWALAMATYSSWFLLAFLQFFYATNLTLEIAFWLMLGISFLSLKTLSAKGEEEKEDALANLSSMSVEFDRTSPLASVLSFVFVIIMVMTISLLYLGGSYYYADILYKKGLDLVSTKNDLDNGVTKITDAVMLNPYNDLYLRSLAQAALLRVNAELVKPQSAERDSQVQNLIATAINIGKRTTDLSPLNVDNWEQRANIYRSVIGYINGAEQWTFDAYQEASNLEPQNPFYYLELGRSYVLAADLITAAAQTDKAQETKMRDYLDKAEMALGKAVTAKPDYAPALFQQSLVFDRQGKIDEAIVKMVETRNAYPNDVGVAFQLGLLYYKKAAWAPAAAEFERAVLLDTNYSNARYFLGLVYDRLGDKAKAIDQFERVLALNQDNQDLVTIIANLKAGKPAIPEVPKNPSELPVNDAQSQGQ